MQNGTPEPAADKNWEKLASHEVKAIYWSAYSRDLNPIETLWRKMGDYILLENQVGEHEHAVANVWGIQVGLWELSDSHIDNLI